MSIQEMYEAMLSGPISVGEGKGTDLKKEKSWTAMQSQQKSQLAPLGNPKPAKISPWRHTAHGKEDLYMEVPGKS